MKLRTSQEGGQAERAPASAERGRCPFPNLFFRRFCKNWQQ